MAAVEAVELGAGIAQRVVERGVALPVGIEPDHVAIGPVTPELRRVAGLGERADRSHQGESEEERKATANERHEETSFFGLAGSSRNFGTLLFTICSRRQAQVCRRKFKRKFE